MLKPSLCELEDLSGREIRSEGDQERAARQVVEQGRSEIVVLSLGAEGALLATADGCAARFAAIQVEARSTVGAGDSMLAGIVPSLPGGLPLHKAVRFGIAAGAAALLGAGHRAVPACAHVERLYQLMSGNKQPIADRHLRGDGAISVLADPVRADPPRSMQFSATLAVHSLNPRREVGASRPRRPAA